MRTLLRVLVVGCISVAAAVFGVSWLMKSDARGGWPRPLGRPSPRAVENPRVEERTTTAPEERLRQDANFIDLHSFEDGGVGLATHFTGPVHDPQSLQQLREAIRVRGQLGLAVLEAELEQLHLDAHSAKAQLLQEALLQKSIGILLMYEGRLAEAAAAFEAARINSLSGGGPARDQAELTALLGITALRRGEIDNCVMCVGPSSCILPIAAEAVHQQQAGSRDAIGYFTAYLAEQPGDLRVRWLLNLACMTLGEYPAKVSTQHLIPLDALRSEADVGRFENVAPLVGLTGRGTNLAGGSIFDDFTGDGRPDLFTTSLDAELGASLYVNRGDGTFEDRSSTIGLADQVYALNVTRADYDNDGNLDVLLLRGAWEKKMRLSLLRNHDNG
jgi:tetratricopeptide (TPR) repeat protein